MGKGGKKKKKKKKKNGDREKIERRWRGEREVWSYQNQENEVRVDDEKPNRRDELPVDEQHGNEQERTVCVSKANLGVLMDRV